MLTFHEPTAAKQNIVDILKLMSLAQGHAFRKPVYEAPDAEHAYEDSHTFAATDRFSPEIAPSRQILLSDVLPLQRMD